MRFEPLRRGTRVVRLAQCEADVELAQSLRHLAFVAGRGRGAAGGRDEDAFDATSHHVLVMEGDLAVACYRLRLHRGGEILNGYAASFYDLGRLTAFSQPMLELGRFCLRPDHHDPDILRLAWAAMAQIVDDLGIGLLFGCSSFEHADPARHGEALSLLAGHLAPPVWAPGRKAAEAISLGSLARPFNRMQALAATPPLLRTYLGMGGWVGDHAVPDYTMDTLHVFTAVEVASIPPGRARALRAIAAGTLG